MDDDTPQFAMPGLADRLADARPRPGAYAVATDGRGRVLLVRALQGWFLPGGGIDPGEGVRAALVREIREETGYACTVLAEIGRADQAVLSLAGANVVNKLGTFFHVRVDGAPGPRQEDDHEPHWIAVAEALTCLTEEAQAWAVRRATDSAANDSAANDSPPND